MIVRSDDYVTGKPVTILPGSAHVFFAEQFIAMAAVRYWQHDHLNTRNNYLFRKPK